MKRNETGAPDRAGAAGRGREAAGNVARMREALEAANAFFRSDNLEELGVLAVRAAMAVQSALSAPPRNCDLYATAEEAHEEFGRFCYTRPRVGKCSGCPILETGGKTNCFAAWLMAPETPEK